MRGSPKPSPSSCCPSSPMSFAAFVGGDLFPDLPPSPPLGFDFLLFGDGENQWETSVPAAAINGSASGPLFASMSCVKSTT